jgi:hypothetical protein
LPADLLRAHFGLVDVGPVEIVKDKEALGPPLQDREEEKPGETEPAFTEEEREAIVHAGREFAAAWVAHAELSELGELMLVRPRNPRELDVQLLLRVEEAVEKSLRAAPDDVRRELRDAFWKELEAAAASS